MSDIVERLKYCAENGIMDASRAGMAAGYGEAAAEIEKLRAALKPFADAAERNLGPDDARIVGDCTLGDLRAAAAALKEMGDE